MCTFDINITINIDRCGKIVCGLHNLSIRAALLSFLHLLPIVMQLNCHKLTINLASKKTRAQSLPLNSSRFDVY